MRRSAFLCFGRFIIPTHERKIRDLIKRLAPEVLVSLSSDVSTVPGEYERTSTTAINAYTGKIVKDYLLNLKLTLSDHGYAGAVMVMQGYGGLLPAEEAAQSAIGMIESGPAAGVIATSFLAELMGDQNVIAADMGGTTFKVSVVQDGRMEYAREPMVGRYHYVAPKIEVFSIGVAGGSVISIDRNTWCSAGRAAQRGRQSRPSLLRPWRDRNRP